MSFFLEAEAYIFNLAKDLYHNPQFRMEDYEVKPEHLCDAHTPSIDEICREVENREYLLSEDAKAISGELCGKGSEYIILFRKTGAYSLQRMRQGHPCKGHEILDKTIKPKNGQWTYSADEQTLKSLCGLVGYSDTPQADGTPVLSGVWALNDEGRAEKMSLANLPQDIRRIFSGDYDIGDVFIDGHMIFSTTSLEKTFLNKANRLLRCGLNENWDRFDSGEGAWLNPYSPIRHGGQSSYMSYLMKGGRKEYDEMADEHQTKIVEHLRQGVVSISLPLCAFLNGKIYEFTTIRDLFNFYELFDLFKQIPFGYFLDNIKSELAANGDQNRLEEVHKVEKGLSEFGSKFKDLARPQILEMIFDTEPIRQEFLQE